MSQLERLLSPVQVGPLELRNRIVMPAVHLNYTPEGKVTDQLVAFYERRAKGGVGLIIVGGCTINALAGGPMFISLQDDSVIEGLRRLTEAVHAHGAKIGAQLYMAGAYTHRMLIGAQPVSSSEHTSAFSHDTARALTLEEIHQIQQDFALAALRAKKAGFDMVEILGSAGYLICQFLSPVINRRDDEYGGDLAGRMRFGLEVVRRVREAVGQDFCVGIRIAGHDFVPGGHTNAEAAIFAHECEAAGVDMVNVTGGWHETKVPQLTVEVPEGAYVYLARGVKRRLSRAKVAASNRLGDPLLAERVLARGDADMICMARALIADPDLPVKAAQGQLKLIRPCIGCSQGCFDSIMKMRPVRCSVNPEAGTEARPAPPPPPSTPGGPVVVVGAGVAGMQAAIAAARRGFKCIVMDRAEAPGGQVRWYARALGKGPYLGIVRWQSAMARSLGVELRLGSEATAEAVVSLEPRAVVVATGARPAGLDVPCQPGARVVSAWDVIQGRVIPGARVVVVGGGATGLEVAVMLAAEGALNPEQIHFLALYKAEPPERLAQLVADGSRDVCVVEMTPKLGQGIGRSRRWIVLGLLRRYGVRTLTSAKVLRITAEGVVVATEGGEQMLKADTVVLATGVLPEIALAEQLKAAGLQVHLVGDAAGPADITNAIASGEEAGRKIV